MTQMPLVLALLVHAAKSVGWNVERRLHSNCVLVTEARPMASNRPRRSWLVLAEELSDEPR